MLTCAPGDEVFLQTRDAVDGQFTLDSTHADVVRIDRSIVHPLTGPIQIEGAQPGDVLAVEVLEIAPASFGYTAQIRGSVSSPTNSRSPSSCAGRSRTGSPRRPTCRA